MKINYIEKKLSGKALFFLSLCLLSIFYYFIFKVKPDTSLIHLIPNDNILKQQYKFIEARNLKFDIIIQLEADFPDSKTILKKAADDLYLSLKNLNLKKIIANFDSVQKDTVTDIIKYYPLIFSKTIEEKLDKLCNKESVSEIFDLHMDNLKKGMGFFYKHIIKEDFLHLSLDVFNEIKDISKNIGLKAYIENGYIFNNDNKKILLLIESGIKNNNSLLNEILNKIKDFSNMLPHKIKMTVISMHFHSIHNEKILKKDINKSFIVISIILITLLLFVYKDIKGIIIFILPIISMLPSVIIITLFFDNISAIALGFGSVIAGISIDYGIHVFSALKSNIKNPYNEIKKPLLISLITTLVAFSVFMFSHVTAFKQIAVFTILSLLFCFIASVFILPLFIKTNTNIDKEDSIKLKITHGKTILIFYCFVLIFLFIYSFNAKIKTDISQYDATPLEIFNEEEIFLKNWHNDDYKVIIAKGNTLSDSLLKNDEVYNKFKKLNISIKSISSILPSIKNRILNAKRWNIFLDKKGEHLHSLINEIKEEKGFSKNSFVNFYQKYDIENSHSHVPESILALSNNFIFSFKDEYFVQSILPDTFKLNNELSDFLNNDNSIFLFSKNEFIKNLTEKTQHEIIYLSLSALILCLIVLFIMFKSLKKVFVALLPALSAITTIIGTYNYYNISITPINIIGFIIITGLSIDYAAFVIHYFCEKKEMALIKGVVLSGITSFLGALILSFAKHPLLFQLGLTLAIGLVISLFTAFFITPYFLTPASNNNKGL